MLCPSLDPFQFAYRPNRSAEDAVSLGLQIALEQVEKTNKDETVIILFVYFGSEFGEIDCLTDILFRSDNKL